MNGASSIEYYLPNREMQIYEGQQLQEQTEEVLERDNA